VNWDRTLPGEAWTLDKPNLLCSPQHKAIRPSLLRKCPLERKLQGERGELTPLVARRIMPVLGLNLPDELVAKTREALLSRIRMSHKLQELGRVTLHRKVYTGDYGVVVWNPRDGFRTVAKFGMLPMPGCRAICIFHHAQVEPEFRNRGIGKTLLHIRMGAARDVGYKILLCTVRGDNEVERHLLTDAYWVKDTIYVATPGHCVELWRKVL
jgi:GNAT superfamily N-acetyltransferase